MVNKDLQKHGWRASKTLPSKVEAYSKQWNLQETELRAEHSCRQYRRRKMTDDKEKKSRINWQALV